MSKRSATLLKSHFNSYSFNKTSIPFPEPVTEKTQPPISDFETIDNSHLFKPKDESTLEEQARQYMNSYMKAERIVVVNFYTGGGAYKKGVLDAIYRGYNPLNPK